MNKKVLVAYTSKAGSTAEVAQFIGNVLVENGVDIEVSAIDQCPDINCFDVI